MSEKNRGKVRQDDGKKTEGGGDILRGPLKYPLKDGRKEEK